MTEFHRQPKQYRHPNRDGHVGLEGSILDTIVMRREVSGIHNNKPHKEEIIMRHRERVVDSQTVTGYYSQRLENWHCPEEDPVFTENESEVQFVKYEHTEAMDDVVTPLYHRLSASGMIINSPMTKVTTILRDNPCSRYTAFGKDQWSTACDPDDFKIYLNEKWWANYPSSSFVSWTDLPEIPSYDQTNIVNQAISQAWANVDVTDIQSLVSLAEGQKTVVSLVAIAKRLISVIKMIKKLEGRKLLIELSPKQLSDRYMELRYALRPLMYEAKGVAAALEEGTLAANDRLTYRGHKSYEADDSTVTTYPVSYTDNCGTWTAEYKLHRLWKHQVSVRSGVLTQLEALNSLNVWGLSQPIESLWELVPFSFVIDWFINVGDTIASFTPDYGIKALASWYTVVDTKYQKVARSSRTDISLPSTSTAVATDWTCNVGDCWLDKTVVTKTRVPNPSRPIIPSFSLNLDCLKLTDLVIIVKGLLGRR